MAQSSSLRTHGDLARSLGPLINDLRNRIDELETRLIESQELTTSLTTDNVTLRTEVESAMRHREEEVKGLKESIQILSGQLKQKQSEETVVLTASLLASRQENEKLQISQSTKDRKLHAFEVELSRSIELIETKDKVIIDLKHRLQESRNSFMTEVNSLVEELRSKDLEMDSLRVAKSRVDMKLVSLERDMEDLLHDRKNFRAVEDQLKDIEKLRMENQQLRSMNIKVLQRSLT